MRTSISRVTSNGTPTSDIVSAEVSFLSEVLGNLRDSGKISNEAYLDAGTIQGGLSIVANLIEQGAPSEEIENQISQLSSKASMICSSHPEIDQQIESFRQ
ncbi:MAG: hypothetical protein CMB68_00365 [Euryarchaeota archaeon]|nr:hypothetical protein [Euryarchaeota archaeon]|tara:strand:- start:20860 stop:21162 length:303 start_codon:yes stop_codon:yes gene_type:complete